MKSGLLPCSLSLFVFVAAGCAGPEAAPKDLDGLARFLYGNFDPADQDPAVVDAELQDAFSKLHDVVEGDGLAEPKQGLLGKLTQAEVDSVGLSDHDPNVPQGIFIADVIHCPLDRLEEIILEPDQLSLYPEAYETYERVYDDERPEAIPTWTLTYKTSENPLITNQFTATVRSGLRKIAATEEARFGRALLRRGFLPKPAVFEEPNDDVQFTHDFQFETYHERAPGEVVHVYGIWRYMKLGVLGDIYDDLFIDQTLSGMLDWDAKTESLCSQ